MLRVLVMTLGPWLERLALDGVWLTYMDTRSGCLGVDVAGGPAIGRFLGSIRSWMVGSAHAGC